MSRVKKKRINFAGMNPFFKIILGILGVAVCHFLIDLGRNHSYEIYDIVRSMLIVLMDIDYNIGHLIIVLLGVGLFIWGLILKRDTYTEKRGKYMVYTADVYALTLFLFHTMDEYCPEMTIYSLFILLILYFITLKFCRRKKIFWKAAVSYIALVTIAENLTQFLDELIHAVLGGSDAIFCWIVWGIMLILQLVAVLSDP